MADKGIINIANLSRNKQDIIQAKKQFNTFNKSNQYRNFKNESNHVKENTNMIKTHKVPIFEIRKKFIDKAIHIKQEENKSKIKTLKKSKTPEFFNNSKKENCNILNSISTISDVKPEIRDQGKIVSRFEKITKFDKIENKNSAQMIIDFRNGSFGASEFKKLKSLNSMKNENMKRNRTNFFKPSNIVNKTFDLEINDFNFNKLHFNSKIDFNRKNNPSKKKSSPFNHSNSEINIKTKENPTFNQAVVKNSNKRIHNLCKKYEEKNNKRKIHNLSNFY